MMEEKRITKKEFDDAVVKAIDAVFDEKRLEGESRFMVSLSGMVFAKKIEEILFGENKVENNANNGM